MKKHSYRKTQSSIIQEVVYDYIGQDPQMYAPHTHDGLEILHILDGAGSVIINDRIFDMVPGSVFIINGESFHCTHPSNPAEYRRNTIQFSPYLLLQMLKLFDLEDLTSMLPEHKEHGYYRTTKEDSGEVHRLFSEMKATDESKEYGSNMLVSDNLFKILLILSKSDAHKHHEQQLSTMQNIALGIMTYVTEHIDDFSLDNLAESLHMSKFYLCHAFKSATGLTINYYLLERRLARAKRMLEKSDIQVSRIAMELGFSSFSHFCRTFKSFVGVTPVQYRKSQKHEETI